MDFSTGIVPIVKRGCLYGWDGPGGFRRWRLVSCFYIFFFVSWRALVGDEPGGDMLWEDVWMGDMGSGRDDDGVVSELSTCKSCEYEH